MDHLEMFAKLLQLQSSQKILLKISLFFVIYTFIKNFKVMSRNSTISFPRNSQMSPRPIFISDSRDTKEWPCFVGQIFFQAYFILRTCLPNYVRKKKSQYAKSLSTLWAKLYIPSTLNIDIILWQTQWIVCAENVKSWCKSWVFPFTFQAYILPHTLNCMCVSLFKLHI